MSLQEEEEEDGEDLQELMGHFRGMQVHMQYLLVAWFMDCAPASLTDSPAHSAGAVPAHAASLHSPCMGYLCMRPQLLSC